MKNDDTIDKSVFQNSNNDVNSLGNLFAINFNHPLNEDIKCFIYVLLCISFFNKICSFFSFDNTKSYL